MMKILIISIIVVIVILLLSVLAISKGYQYKHTVDEMPAEYPGEKENDEESSRK
ncbi:YtzI protein [Bacillus marinisedimentorum]|uniref:YtzI protein n=1 Tax=Bacillus marinisedimentorum TaxID=1821260 RepID=UPI000872A61F|nr:YtzI protein [Bacillus marinisedimentorum]